MNNPILNCCGIRLIDTYALVKHLKDNHVLNGYFVDEYKHQFPLKCVFEDCDNGPYKKLKYFKNHLICKHADFVHPSTFDFSLNSVNDNQSAPQSYNFLEDIPASDYENDYAMAVEVQSKEIPSFIKSSSAFNITPKQEFSLILQNCKLDNKITQRAVSEISFKVLNFIKQNSEIQLNIIDDLIPIANSGYLQLKECDKVLNYTSLIVKNQLFNGLEFTVIDMRKQIEHLLSKEHILTEIFNDRFGKKNCKFFF